MKTLTEYIQKKHITNSNSPLVQADFLYPTIIGINTSIDSYINFINLSETQKEAKRYNEYYTEIYDRANAIEAWSDDLTPKRFWYVNNKDQKADYAYCALYPIKRDDGNGKITKIYRWSTGYSINNWAKEDKQPIPDACDVLASLTTIVYYAPCELLNNKDWQQYLQPYFKQPIRIMWKERKSGKQSLYVYLKNETDFLINIQFEK